MRGLVGVSLRVNTQVLEHFALTGECDLGRKPPSRGLRQKRNEDCLFHPNQDDDIPCVGMLLAACGNG